MKILLKMITFILVAVLLAILLSSIKTGHVIIFVWHYRLDLSLISLFLMILLVFLILYYLISIIGGLQSLPDSIKSWSKRYFSNRRHKYLEVAIISFLAKNYKKSYKSALKVLDNNIQNKTTDKFIALCIAIETADAAKNSNKDVLIKEFSQYDSRNYKSAKDTILKQL